MDSFLKSALRGEKYKAFPFTPEGSERRYTRIKTKNRSWVLASSPLDQKKKFFAIHKLLSQKGLNVPKIKAHKKQYYLLEDLGDYSLEKRVFGRKTFPLSFYRLALDQIIKMQKSNRQGSSPRQGGALPRVRFTAQDFFNEMLYTEKYLIKKLFRHTPSPSFRKKYLKEWKYICHKLSGFSYSLAHADFHCRNLFIKDRKIYLIDFQDAVLFPRFYDAISLLYDVYIYPKLKEKDRKKLLEYFIRKSGFVDTGSGSGPGSGIGIGSGSGIGSGVGSGSGIGIGSGPGSGLGIEEEVLMTALQRLFKAQGRFAGFYVLKNQSTHLKHIRPVLQMLKRLLKTSSFPAFATLVDQLLDSHYNRQYF